MLRMPLGCGASEAESAPTAAPAATATQAPTPAPTAAPTPEPTPVRTVKGFDYVEPEGFQFDRSDLQMKASDGSFIAYLLSKSQENVIERSEADYL